MYYFFMAYFSHFYGGFLPELELEAKKLMLTYGGTGAGFRMDGNIVRENSCDVS